VIENPRAEERFLDLLKRCLTRYDLEETQRYRPGHESTLSTRNCQLVAL